MTRSPLTPERLEELKKQADSLDERIDNVRAEIRKIKHDQTSHRTALLGLFHELDNDDIARGRKPRGVNEP